MIYVIHRNYGKFISYLKKMSSYNKYSLSLNLISAETIEEEAHVP